MELPRQRAWGEIIGPFLSVQSTNSRDSPKPEVTPSPTFGWWWIKTDPYAREDQRPGNQLLIPSYKINECTICSFGLPSSLTILITYHPDGAIYPDNVLRNVIPDNPWCLSEWTWDMIYWGVALPGYVRLHVYKEEERMGRTTDPKFGHFPLAPRRRSLGFPHNVVPT